MLAARLGAKMDSLSPFLKDSFIPNNMPVYPGAASGNATSRPQCSR